MRKYARMLVAAANCTATGTTCMLSESDARVISGTHWFVSDCVTVAADQWRARL